MNDYLNALQKVIETRKLLEATIRAVTPECSIYWHGNGTIEIMGLGEPRHRIFVKDKQVVAEHGASEEIAKQIEEAINDTNE